MSWLVALKRIRLAFIVLFVAMATLVFSACSRNVGDYTGSWMGIDETGNNYSVYQCDIVAVEDGNAVTIRMTQYRYVLSSQNKIAVWQATEPHYFQGYVNSEGNLVTDIGVISAKPDTFQLQYGNITMTRKAKNTEVKFKYIARNHLEEQYPEMLFND